MLVKTRFDAYTQNLDVNRFTPLDDSNSKESGLNTRNEKTANDVENQRTRKICPGASNIQAHEESNKDRE